MKPIDTAFRNGALRIQTVIAERNKLSVVVEAISQLLGATRTP
jgi:hypothetical protein